MTFPSSGVKRLQLPIAITLLLFLLTASGLDADDKAVHSAAITGNEPGFRDLTADDFVNVNCAEDTWQWKENTLYCTGIPTGVLRTKKQFTNCEIVAEWCHRKPGGNSGIFLWTTEASIEKLESEGKPGLPHGVEVQILDLDYGPQYEERTGKKGDWFTSHGDIFPVGVTRMTLFEPLSPNGSRSFPSENRSRGANEWNHYYVRAINGEVRLWVNGGEVSGGKDCQPASGYICLESEGAPIEFRKLRIRELP
ncbi:DUF1080 domain-containing protein [Rubinisphaera sp.]|uniref:3-keto-disaccharide hydrolase n=1 Tax=Rubinisphaera sp. TaxID=2024857 RepID=UPI000C11DA21|nr:DUF1080 domain-containing protein [Rubinisphaera sp.]MBV07860.1 hypothetical protein [Rubinisphaera sp.]HCS50393.1 DUF1080 domain-containing protein [Planctomycetaceae bacterium]|tara:strand:- start:2463 stop:3218 length:756 start_codon:yes stop_codon:yes gene_type:complete